MSLVKTQFLEHSLKDSMYGRYYVLLHLGPGASPQAAVSLGNGAGIVLQPFWSSTSQKTFVHSLWIPAIGILKETALYTKPFMLTITGSNRLACTNSLDNVSH